MRVQLWAELIDRAIAERERIIEGRAKAPAAHAASEKLSELRDRHMELLQWVMPEIV